MTTQQNKIEEELTRESIFIIGHVYSVDGRVVTVKVNKNKNHSHIVYQGNTVKNVSVGSYIKIVKGFINIIGKVEGESIKEEKYFNQTYNKEETKIDRSLQVSLFGHFEGNLFKQGIKEMPLIGNECYVLDKEEFNILHQFYKHSEKTITIGGLTEEPSQKIKISVNKLFASHIGIFGNTGSGKSNTLARIYTELFTHYNSGNFKTKSKFVVIDFNGEYANQNVLTTSKNVYNLTTSTKGSSKKYPVAKEGIRKLEVLSVLLEATEKTQTPFLSRVLSNKILDEDSTFNVNAITNIQIIFQDIINKKVDKFFGGTGFLLELCRDLNYLVEVNDDVNPIETLKGLIETHFNYNATTLDYYWNGSETKTYDNTTPIYENYLKETVDKIVFKQGEFNKIKVRIILNYYHEIIKGFANQEHIRPLIGRMFKKLNMLEKLVEVETEQNATPETNNLTVISLRDVNTEMKKILPLIICKQLYDEKKSDEDTTKSLHIIIDEAHNILSSSSQRESETWKDYRLETFEEIIKEGRKFGTFLTIASQRPYDISSTIISQLHNYFIHRLINENDIQAVSKTVAYLDKLSFQTIPILSVGSCFVAGLASDLPVKVDIDLLDKKDQPSSETINLENAWGI